MTFHSLEHNFKCQNDRSVSQETLVFRKTLQPAVLQFLPAETLFISTELTLFKTSANTLRLYAFLQQSRHSCFHRVLKSPHALLQRDNLDGKYSSITFTTQLQCKTGMLKWPYDGKHGLSKAVHGHLQLSPQFSLHVTKGESLLQILIAEHYPSKIAHFFYQIYCGLLSNAHLATCSQCKTHLLFISCTEDHIQNLIFAKFCIKQRTNSYGSRVVQHYLICLKMASQLEIPLFI